MNTPAHVVVGLATLTGSDGRSHWKSVLAGSLLPDLPMFAFFLWQTLILGSPQSTIWNEAYFRDSWQLVFDLFNSIPLAALGLALSWRWLPGRLFFAAVILHCAFDLPLHHDDGHRHFLPISQWRFRSPVSYWDPAHHGGLGAGFECGLVLVGSAVLWRRFRGFSSRLLIAFSALVSVGGFAAWWAFALTASDRLK